MIESIFVFCLFAANNCLFAANIRIKIKYPREGMYHCESDMGRAMSDITSYSLVGSNAHDDSIDCCASLLILDEKKIKNEIFALNINL